MGLALPATLIRLLHSERSQRIGAVLAPAGRMALSNYLGQSVATLLVFAGQAVLSRWWLGRFAYGPAEWLLRWITNGTRPAWRNAAT